MEFIAVLIVALFHNHWIGGNPVRDRLRMDGWFNASAEYVSSGWLMYGVAMLPALALVVIGWVIDGFFLQLLFFFVSLIVLVYCVDILDLDLAFDEQGLWLRSLKDDDDLAQLSQAQQNFRSDVTYELFQGFGAPVFWFLLLGPGGALFYLMTRLYLESLDDDDEELDVVDQALFILEWPAVRLMVLLIALLGNFSRGWNVLLESILNVEDEAYVILQESLLVDGTNATSIPGFADQVQGELVEMKLLLERSLWGWVSIAAILVIADW